MRTYLHNLLVACDQLVNALMGGWPDETLSSRCWRWHVSGVRHWPCRWLAGWSGCPAGRGGALPAVL